jgi:hypothetical protein
VYHAPPAEYLTFALAAGNNYHPGMVTINERVARAVLEHFPYAYCLPCLAVDLAVTETEARSAVQMLVLQDAFKVVRRVCCGCSRTDDVVVPRAPAAAPHQRWSR